MQNPITATRTIATKDSGQKSTRLFIGIAFAVMLACLPVLPVKIADIAGIPSNMTLSNVQATLQGFFQSKVKAPAKPKEAVATKPLTEMQLLEQAARELTVEISNSPYDPALYNRLGLVYLGLGELDSAEAQFIKAVDLGRIALATSAEKLKKQVALKNKEASETLIEQTRLNVELAAAHSNLARIYEQLGDQDKVVTELNQLNSLGTISGNHKQSRLTSDMPAATARLFTNAQTLMASGMLTEAIQKYRQAEIVSPNLPVIHQQLGLAYLLVQNPTLATAELEKAIRLDPSNAETHNNLGLAYQTEGNTLRAKQEFETAVKIKPSLATASLNLGNLNSANGHWGAAEAAYQKAIVADNKSALAHNNLAAIYSMQGLYAKTIAEFRKAIAIDPKMASAHYGLGLALYNSGKYLASVPEFRQAATLNPSLTDAQAKIESAMRKAGTSL